MADYASIDPDINAWSKKHSLSLFTSWAGRDTRCAYVSSASGVCFQIWIDPPVDGKVALHAACVEGHDDLELQHDWLVPLGDLSASLETVFQVVVEWLETPPK